METRAKRFVEQAKEKIEKIHLSAIRELLEMWDYNEDENYKGYRLSLNTCGLKLKWFKLSDPNGDWVDCLHFYLTMEDILFILENEVPLSVYRLWETNFPNDESRERRPFMDFADVYKSETDFKEQRR